MIRGLRHVGLVVRDLDLEILFYTHMLGFLEVYRADESGEPLEKMLGIEGVTATTVKLMAPDGNMLELLQFDRPAFARHGITTSGFSHIALTVERLDSLYASLKNLGVRFLGEPVKSGAYRVAFALDPEGNAVELVEPLQ